MTINADGSHAVQPHAANAHTAPARPVRHAVVEEEVLEPLGPVEGWGFTNRVILVSVLVVIIGNVVRVLTGDLGDPNGSVALGETGHGWVVLVQSFMFGLVAVPAPDQRGPAQVSPTGQDTGADPATAAQGCPYLTTAHGVRLQDSDHSLKAGRRGPTLLQDHHLREKLSHFDHERIPERVVHARGAGAHGVFRGYGTAAKISRAGLFAKDKETEVWTPKPSIMR